MHIIHTVSSVSSCPWFEVTVWCSPSSCWLFCNLCTRKPDEASCIERTRSLCSFFLKYLSCDRLWCPRYAFPFDSFSHGTRDPPSQLVKCVLSSWSSHPVRRASLGGVCSEEEGIQTCGGRDELTVRMVGDDRSINSAYKYKIRVFHWRCTGQLRMESSLAKRFALMRRLCGRAGWIRP